jgi:hypothetical protein
VSAFIGGSALTKGVGGEGGNSSAATNGAANSGDGGKGGITTTGDGGSGGSGILYVRFKV